MKAATAVFEILNIVCAGIAKVFGQVDAVASVLIQEITALLCPGQVVTGTVRALAFVRILAAGDSEGGEVEE